jgi:hypothetical protein
VPENNLYIYFRQLPEKGVMVVVNASDKTARIPLHRLSEPLKDVQSLQEVITESRQMLKEYWTIPGKCARIYEYQKETQPQEPSPQYDQNKGKR